jgi:hypothetical protein
MVDIAEVFVLSFVGLNGGSSFAEFFLRLRFELTWAIRIKPRTSAPSKLRWIFGMRCSSLWSSVVFSVTSCQKSQLCWQV